MAPPAAPASGSSSLDLDEPAAAARVAPPVPVAPLSPAAPAAPVASSLDLSDPPAARPATPRPVARPAVRARTRVPANGRMILNRSTPTVTLTRVASGIGTLTAHAAISSELGEIQLGCAYQLATGASSFVQRGSAHASAPDRARLPLIVSGRDQFERIALDLRQVGQLQRIVFVVHTANRASVTWDGTLVFTTHAGHRVEVPLAGLPPAPACAAVSLYQVDGELVLRSELQIAASVRDACTFLGYDDISWLDDRTPLQ